MYNYGYVQRFIVVITVVISYSSNKLLLISLVYLFCLSTESLHFVLSPKTNPQNQDTQASRGPVYSLCYSTHVGGLRL